MQFKIGDLVQGKIDARVNRRGPFVVIGFDKDDDLYLYDIRQRHKTLDYASMFERIKRR